MKFVNRFQSIHFGIMLSLLAAVSYAQTGTVIILRGRGSDLPRNKHLHLEVTVHYTLAEFPNNLPHDGVLRPLPNDSIRYTLSAPEHLVWDFVVPTSGVADMSPFRFTLPQRLLAPPRGILGRLTFATIFFPVPSTAAHHPAQGFSLPIIDNVATVDQCLKIEGGPKGILTVGIVPNCATSLASVQTTSRRPR